MKTKYMEGFIAGSILGIALGMLLNPGMGSEVRKRLVNGGKGLLGNAAQVIPLIKQK